MSPRRSPPGLDEIRREEIAHIVRRFMRVRVVSLLLGTIALITIVSYDTAAWKQSILVGFVLLITAVMAFDVLRLMRSPGYAHRLMLVDLMLMLLMQTGVIWLTGAMESPLAPIYVPLGIMSGVALGPSRSRWVLLACLSAFIWLMTLGALYDALPRTIPSFFHLGPGFYDRAAYVITSAALLNLVSVVGSQAGVGIYRAIDRMLRQAFSAREQALELALDRNRELVNLTSAIAHELKNPLASVQGLVQLQMRGGDPERQAARHEVLSREILRMREVLDSFLNFSRPLGELTVKTARVDRLLEDVTALHEGMAASRGITIAPAQPRDLSLRCDPRKLKQALTNLLQNAIEATPQGGEVTWHARRDGTTVELGVQDSGPGLDEGLLSRATDVGVTNKPTGSGIGLAVVRAIAEQHGGSLSLDNPPGGGCRATLRLPEEGPLAGADAADPSGPAPSQAPPPADAHAATAHAATAHLHREDSGAHR